MPGIELVPKSATIKSIISESPDVNSFVLQCVDDSKLIARPGQFIELSLQGIGEAAFAVSRISSDYREFQVSIKRIGHLTRMLHRTAEGDVVGIRGPYGNDFPLQDWKGKGILIIGGGIGMAPLRPVIDYLLNNRADYKDINIIFGARTPQDILFRKDMESWHDRTDISLVTTIDIPYEGWTGRVGLLPAVIKDLDYRPDNRIVIFCGPPIMIKFTTLALTELGWKKSQLFTTLEMKMQCGIGQCGRCNIGDKFVCKDGPVFRLDQIPV